MLLLSVVLDKYARLTQISGSNNRVVVVIVVSNDAAVNIVAVAAVISLQYLL